MAFPVDVLTAVEPESLEATAKDYITQLHRNLTTPEHLNLSDSQKIKIELCNMSFVPLYGANSSSKVLALFSSDNLYKVVGLYLLGQWWSIEDVLKTSDPSRTGLISVSTIGERVVLYVLNRIIYREKEKGGEDIAFLCHCEQETAKILWKDGKAIGFYSVKLKGSLCSSFLTLPFELHVMDTIFVRQSHRGSGHGLQMLEDFIQGFKKESLGLKCPVSPSMYKVCEKYFSVHPVDRERLWEVKGTGSPFQRTLVAKRFPKLQVKDQVVSKLNFEDDHFITPMETEIEKLEIVEKTTRNVVKKLDSTPVKRCVRCCKPLCKEKQISEENRTRVEDTAVFKRSTVGLTGETLLKKEKKQHLGKFKASLGEVSVSHFGATGKISGKIKEQELCYTKTQSATILSMDQRQVGEEKMVQRNTESESEEQNNTMIGLEEEALIIENRELQQMSDEFKRQKAASDTYMDKYSQMPHEVGVEKEIETNKVSITNQAENRSDLEKKKGHCEEEIQEKSQTCSVDKMTSEGFVEKTPTTENDSHVKEQKSLIETESTVLKRSTQTVSQLVYKETDQTATFSPSQVSEQHETFVEDNASESVQRTKEESLNIQKQHKGKVKQKMKNVFTVVEETVSTYSTSLRRSTRVKAGTRQEESSGPDDALNSSPEHTTMRPTTEDSNPDNTQDVDHETFEMLRDVEEVLAEANQDAEEKADDKRETFQISETCGGEMDQDIAEHETVHVIQDSEKGGLNEETEPDGYEVNANDSPKDLNQDSDKTKGGEAALGAFTFSEVSEKPNTLVSNEKAKGKAQSEEELQEDVHEEERMEAENTMQKQDVQDHKVGTSGVMESQVEVYRETEAIVEENVSTVEEGKAGGLKCTHECETNQETDEGQGHHVLQVENEQQTTRETIIMEGHKSAVNGKPVEHVSWIEIAEANNEANSHSSDLTVSSFRSKVQPTPSSTSSQRKAGIQHTERSEMEVNFNSDEIVVEQHNVSDEIIENMQTVDEDSECANVSRDSEIITGTSQDSITEYVEEQMRVEAKNDKKLENTGPETSIEDMEMVDIFEEEASTSTERCLRKRTIHIQHVSSPPRKKSKHLNKIQPNVVELEKRSENKIADDDDDDVDHHQIIEKQNEETDQEILEIQHPEIPMDERPILEDICLDLENEHTDPIIVLQKDTVFLKELNKPIEETEEDIEIAKDQAHTQNQENWEKTEKQDPVKLPSKHENPHVQVTELDYEAKTPHEGHTVEEHDKQSRTTEKINYAMEFVEENGGIIVNQISTSGEPEKPTQKGTIESHQEHSVIQTEGGREIISCVKEKTICETLQEDDPVITERNLRQRTINVPLKQTTPTKKSKLVQKQEIEHCQNIAIPKTTGEEDIVESFEGEAPLLKKTTESDVPSTRFLLETGPLVENVEEKQMESETVLMLKPSQCVSGKNAQSAEIFSHIEDTETDFEKTTRRSLRLSSRPVVFTPKAQSKHTCAEKLKTTKEGSTDECENICADVETVHICVSSMAADDSLKIIQYSGDMVSSEHDTHTLGSVSDAHSKEPPGDENITESSVHIADRALVRVDQSEADEQNYNDNVTGKDGGVMQLQEYRCDMVTLDSSQSLKILAEAVMEKRVLRKRIISTGSPHKSKRICKQEHAEEHKKNVSEKVKFTSGVSAVEDITQQIQKDLEKTASDATTQEENTTDRPEDHKDEQTEVDDNIEVTGSNRDEIIDVEEKHEETEKEQVESSRNKFFTLELEEEEKSDQPEDTDQNKMVVDVPKEIITCLEKSVEVEENISEVEDDDGDDEDDEEQDHTAQRISDQQSVIGILKKHQLEVNEDEEEEHKEVEDKHDVSESPRKGRKAMFSDDSTPLRRSKRLEIKKFA